MLRAGSVYMSSESPPSRAAWIEIRSVEKSFDLGRRRRLHGRRGLKCGICLCKRLFVGRRLHGRRGLKLSPWVSRCHLLGSPPSRAAWIEIPHVYSPICAHDVAAFMGGVD